MLLCLMSMCYFAERFATLSHAHSKPPVLFCTLRDNFYFTRNSESTPFSHIIVLTALDSVTYSNSVELRLTSFCELVAAASAVFLTFSSTSEQVFLCFSYEFSQLTSPRALTSLLSPTFSTNFFFFVPFKYLSALFSAIIWHAFDSCR